MYENTGHTLKTDAPLSYRCATYRTEGRGVRLHPARHLRHLILTTAHPPYTGAQGPRSAPHDSLGATARFRWHTDATLADFDYARRLNWPLSVD